MKPTFRITGTQEDLHAFQQALVKEFKDGEIVISEPTPVKAKLNSRDPYRQSELLMLVISIATGLATSALYDLLKTTIEKLQHAHTLKVQEENEQDELDPE